LRALLIVLDGVGAGALPDADAYGDAGSHTLMHVAEANGGLRVPNLERLGFGHIAPLAGVRRVAAPTGCWGRMAERSPGKDSTTGHWEMMGVILERPFPLYPRGFPTELLDRWSERVGRGWLGNVAASGTEIIQRLGEDHQRTGRYIVYTSADSVFQVAAHKETVPLDELYRACAEARALLQGEHAVGRVIARPFVGTTGRYTRTPERRDFSLPPPAATLLDRLARQGRSVLTVGKVDELFAGRGVAAAVHTRDNRHGMEEIAAIMRRSGDGLVFANLVDFDTQFGHRNNPKGFAGALEEFDARLAEVLSLLRADELCVITADHGNDPTTTSTDHSREFVPLLATGPRARPGVDLRTRESFADLGATLAEFLGVEAGPAGRSFLQEMRG
jgi:phosphopentomutase